MGVEEELQLYPVLLALRALALAQPIWKRNYRAFDSLSLEKKLVWWTFVKQSDLPMYQTLKLKVIELRMNQ